MRLGRVSWVVWPVAFGALLVAPTAAHAQTVVKPYVLVIFDTSGSMGSGSGCGGGDRIDEAVAAMGEVFAGIGEVTFALQSFIDESTCQANCNCDNASCIGGDVHVPFAEDNLDDLYEWVDGTCNFPGDPELRAFGGGGTPLAANLDAARIYLENTVIPNDPQNLCRPYIVVLVTDGEETCDSCQAAADAATALCNVSIAGRNEIGCDVVKTYVIGFDVSGACLNDIAAEGGTGRVTATAACDRTSLALAFQEIIEESVLIEVCDGVDNDCDAEVDEGFPLYCDIPGGQPDAVLCADPGDPCDGVDDNCAAGLDDEPRNACGGCGPAPQEVCDGVDNDCDVAIDEGNVCAGCVPGPEICDALDNDCDGLPDDDMTRPCGTDVGECTRGNQTCALGAWGPCGGQGPVAEVCNNLDDNCDGVVDGIIESCGTDEGECLSGSRRCEAGAFGPCLGGIGPALETCDGLDNDCDAFIDETDPALGVPCGSDEGECQAGTFECVLGELQCDGVGPSPELCDTLDNDCDGLVDDGNPGGGAACGLTDVGECSDGVLQCVDGLLDCIGWQGPSPEICDDRDNDCDGLVDEDNPGGGAPCGTDEGECTSGTTQCIGGDLVCSGVGPGEEVCDEVDNDCDGAIDEGLPIGEACGTDVGECEPGLFFCVDGVPICQGETPPSAELCDGLDNDCDGSVDEGLGLGEECGKKVGLCKPGRYQCVEGELQCVGGTPLQEEQCDCEDNDCDNLVDENPDDMCPDGARCVDCNCALPCSEDLEFPCPAERQCVEGYCVRNPCSGVTCAHGERCREGACVLLCDLVSCAPGTRCAEGLCLADDCFHFPEDCAEDEACIDGECQADPCEAVACGEDEYCRAGDCVGLCVDVRCADRERCVDGRCEQDPCAGATCAASLFCDPRTGDCAEDACVSVDCPLGQVCDRTTGECGDDPCNLTRCPEGLVCELGICDRPGRDDREEPIGRRVLATGGGGCACSSTPDGGPRGAVFVLLVSCLTLAIGRRSTRRPVLLAVALLAAGCKVDPYCIDCPDPAGNSRDGGGDAGWIRYDGGAEGDGGGGAEDDGGPVDCVPGAAELCNGRDDDCDGDIDEGIDFSSPAHCGSCDNVCILPHTFPTCEDGVCGIDHCDVGASDLNGDVSDGCEYSCLPTRGDDAECNGRDDDCDGIVDEDVDLDRDLDNCGRCGERCSYLHGVGACEGGQCRLASCDDDFHDVNADPADGCEYRCVAGGDEVCDARDNDCDGEVDQGNPGGGQVCGSSDVGACQLGIQSCETGRFVCAGEVAPVEELCNLEDDDCDGEVDEGSPEGGRFCGTDEGECVAGRTTCTSGNLDCVGARDPVDEVCDARDNDCDGTIDDGDPGGGAACGIETGECALGVERCVGGVIVCQGASGPRLEACNGLDDDCDVSVDEDFDFDRDLGNCGGCGITCTFANAFPICNAGFCEILACENGFFDRNGLSGDGCEVACEPAGAEVCNGLDDDCDGNRDNDLQPPANYCNPNGQCARTVAICQGAPGWTCTYGPTVEQDGEGNILPETRCDDLDNDCDGSVDEHVPLKGTPCGHGIGICRRAGVYVCDSFDVQAPVVCNAPPAGNPGAESCNGLDDDCNGIADDGFADDLVQVAANLWIYRHEAARPDATGGSQGSSRSRSCSRAGVMPWTNVSWIEADAACQAAGFRLCTETEWELACAGGAGNNYPYGDVFDADACNGEEYDPDCVLPDDDLVLPTESPHGCPAPGASQCVSEDGAIDLSGNVREWTATQVSINPPAYRIRGGSKDNIQPGLSCGFDFGVGSEDFFFDNLGFRCCNDSPP